MRSQVTPSSSFALLLVLGLLGCQGHPSHPVLSDHASSPAKLPAAGRGPEALVGLAARQALFRGLSDMEQPLRQLRAGLDTRAPFPRLTLLPEVERAVRRRYPQGSPLGPIRNIAAFGLCGAAPLTPGAMADLLMHDEAERQALAATTFEEIGRETDEPGRQRRRYRVEMLRRGLGPVRYDFRFTTTTERWDLADGSVIMRYDPAHQPDGEGVTLYRGVCLIEPVGQGSLVTELVIMGTDLVVPFFLRRAVRDASIKVFQDRVQAIWTRAAWRAQGRDPLLRPR